MHKFYKDLKKFSKVTKCLKYRYVYVIVTRKKAIFFIKENE